MMIKKAQALYNLAEKLFNKEEYLKVIDLLTNEILEEYKESDLYCLRAWSYNRLGKGNVALSDSEIAISLNKNNPNAYTQRGSAKTILYQFLEAIDDYNYAIELDPNFIIAYSNRAICWQGLQQYEKAIDDCNIAISIDPKFAHAYSNRGFARQILYQLNGDDDNLKKAFEDLKTAIELDPKSKFSHANLGLLYEKQNDYENALFHFNKAKALGHLTSKYSIARINAILGRKISQDEIEEFETLSIIIELTENLPTEDKIYIRKKSASILINEIAEIFEETENSNEKHIVHYTKLRVAQLLIDLPNKPDIGLFRYNNAAYMNDPEEGEVITYFLQNDSIKCAFKNGSRGQSSNFYIGSFLPADLKVGKRSHDDDLVMWRTYGKDDDRNEACGCSIMYDIDFIPKEEKKADDINTVDYTKRFETEKLYKVLYYNNREQQFEGEKYDPIKGKRVRYTEEDDTRIKAKIAALEKILSEIIDKYKGNDKIENIIDQIVYHILSQIRFIFKSADYAFENELRVLLFAKPENKDKVKLYEVTEGSLTHKRMFLESKNIARKYIERIVLGPKVSNPENWLYLATIIAQEENGKTIEIKKSDCRYK